MSKRSSIKNAARRGASKARRGASKATGSGRRRGNRRGSRSKRPGIKDVFVGIIIGFVLLIGSFGALLWNEIESVKIARALDEGADAVISIDTGQVDSANDGELVHFTDTVDTEEILQDPHFPLERQAIGLKRNVEMYQWHEESRTEGSGDDRVTVYDYRTDWSQQEIDSSRFNQTSGHQNPSSMPFDQFSTRADHVSVGDFELTSTFIRQLSQYSDVSLDDEFLQQANAAHGQHNFVLDGNRLYIGENPTNPQVGDVRISFSNIEPHTVSAIGQQQGSRLTSYETSGGRSLAMLSAGNQSATEMFEAAQAANVVRTWGIRFGGVLAMFIGWVLIFGPISFVARYIPILGNLIIGAKKLVAAGLTFFLAGGTIATGWLIARPLIGIPLCLFTLMMGVGFFALAFFLVKKRGIGEEEEELEPVDGMV